MNANELRIGNYAIVKDAPIEAIIRVRAQHIAEAEEHNPSWFLYPINLTPEILEKCGFKCLIGMHYELKIGGDSDMHLTYWAKDDFYFNIYTQDGEGKLPIKTQYLHQLQNLYFALTGTELTVNL
jgi:hypothetical protein